MAVRYVERLGRVFEALTVLDMYPDGLLISDLAAFLECSEADLRVELAAFNLGTEHGSPGESAFVEFLAELPEPGLEEEPDELFVEAGEAQAVRLPRLFGAGRGGWTAGGLSVAELGAVLVAAEDLLRVEPGNEALAAVVATLRATWLPTVTEVWHPSRERMFEADLARAVSDRRKVRLLYERAWKPGVVEHVVEPLDLVRTKRGFELDAGPVRENGRVRTYLVSNIRQLRVLEETFERPADAAALCAANRQTVAATLVIPRRAAWLVEHLPEAATPLSGDATDDDVAFRVELLEPVASRAGLLLMQAGPEAFFADPPELADTGRDSAVRLLAHHGLSDST